MTLTRNIHVLDALAYKAPFLIDKLLKDHVVDTATEADMIFSELKRYFVLVQSDPTADWKMYSLRVDEVWHQFVLFTREYISYCQRSFGIYIQHNPSNAPEHNPDHMLNVSTAKRPSTFDGFRRHYEEFFAIPLPSVWYDHESVTLRRRVLHNKVGQLTLRTEKGMVELLNITGQVLISVTALATDALQFIAHTGSFYVRELPGGLTDDEKIGLVAALVECSFLRVAP